MPSLISKIEPTNQNKDRLDLNNRGGLFYYGIQLKSFAPFAIPASSPSVPFRLFRGHLLRKAPPRLPLQAHS